MIPVPGEVCVGHCNVCQFPLLQPKCGTQRTCLNALTDAKSLPGKKRSHNPKCQLHSTGRIHDDAPGKGRFPVRVARVVNQTSPCCGDAIQHCLIGIWPLRTKSIDRSIDQVGELLMQLVIAKRHLL